MQQLHQPGLPFDQGADGRALVFANDEITFPMASFGSIGRWEWAVVDGQHRMLEPGSAALQVLLSAAVVSSGPQR